MSTAIQTTGYIFQLIFLVLFFVFIIVCAIRQLQAKFTYDADVDEMLIEMRCLTVTKQHWFGQTSVELRPGTYNIGTSALSELRIKDTGTRFNGSLEVLETGECRLYINSGAFVFGDRVYDNKSPGYVTINPGDVFTIGRQTCMINRLAEQTPDA